MSDEEFHEERRERVEAIRSRAKGPAHQPLSDDELAWIAARGDHDVFPDEAERLVADLYAARADIERLRASIADCSGSCG